MPIYTPTNGVVNFTLQEYTPPSNTSANFIFVPAPTFNKITFGTQFKPMIISNVGKPIIFK